MVGVAGGDQLIDSQTRTARNPPGSSASTERRYAPRISMEMDCGIDCLTDCLEGLFSGKIRYLSELSARIICWLLGLAVGRLPSLARLAVQGLSPVQVDN